MWCRAPPGEPSVTRGNERPTASGSGVTYINKVGAGPSSRPKSTRCVWLRRTSPMATTPRPYTVMAQNLVLPRTLLAVTATRRGTVRSGCAASCQPEWPDDRSRGPTQRRPRFGTANNPLAPNKRCSILPQRAARRRTQKSPGRVTTPVAKSYETMRRSAKTSKSREWAIQDLNL